MTSLEDGQLSACDADVVDVPLRVDWSWQEAGVAYLGMGQYGEMSMIGAAESARLWREQVDKSCVAFS